MNWQKKRCVNAAQCAEKVKRQRAGRGEWFRSSGSLMYDCMSRLIESARVHHALATKTTSRRAALSHHNAHPHFVFTLRHWQH